MRGGGGEEGGGGEFLKISPYLLMFTENFETETF